MGSEHGKRLDGWMQSTTRYVILTNAGGAVASLSLIGTSMAGGGFPKLAVAPLACYAIGLFLAGLVLHGQLTGAYRAFLTADTNPLGADHSIMRHLSTRVGDWLEPRTGRTLVASFVLFVLGTLLGLVALLVW